jgi:hypothetical protein
MSDDGFAEHSYSFADEFDDIPPEEQSAAQVADDDGKALFYSALLALWLYLPGSGQTGIAPDSVIHAEIDMPIAAGQMVLRNLTNQLYAGDITLAQWQAGVVSELKDAHLAQALFGAGGRSQLTDAGLAQVRQTLSRQIEFLRKFTDDIAAGRISERQALSRISQYANATRQSFWIERERSISAERRIEIDWMLSVAEHCDDCLALAAGSPYRPGELGQYPGDGGTQCRGNCQCFLVFREV